MLDMLNPGLMIFFIYDFNSGIEGNQFFPYYQGETVEIQAYKSMLINVCLQSIF